jgi:hypothetical protein
MTHRAASPIVLAAALAAGLAAAPARAGDPVVVELFTSQGCSSCPPADEILADLAEREDVIALSLHVDYWDYLGWRDTFARREFTLRQYSYRDAWNERVVYTPQIVVQGAESVPAADEAAVGAAIGRAQAMAVPGGLVLGEAGGMLRLGRSGSFGPEAVLWIATYDLASDVSIARGENAGRMFTYRNVVTGLERLGPVAEVPEGHALPLPDPGEGVAVWVQEGPGGRILAAASRETGEALSVKAD